MTYQPDDPNWYDRPNAYYDADGTLHLRASSIGGSCYKALGMDAAKNKNPNSVPIVPAGPDKFLLAAFEESAALEQQAFDIWWDKFNIGHDFHNGPDAEWVQLRLESGRYVIDGTTDFSVIHRERAEHVTVEIKAVGAKLFAELEETMSLPWFRLSGLPNKYRFQVAVYVYGLDRPCTLAVCEKENGGLTGRVIEHTYYPGSSLLPGLDHLGIAAAAINLNAQRILAGDAPFQCENSDSKCRWADICQAPVKVNDEDISILARMYAEAQQLAKHNTKKADEAKAKLREKAEEHGGRIVDQYGNKVTVTVSEIPERVVTSHTRTTVRITPTKDTKEDT